MLWVLVLIFVACAPTSFIGRNWPYREKRRYSIESCRDFLIPDSKWLTSLLRWPNTSVWFSDRWLFTAGPPWWKMASPRDHIYLLLFSASRPTLALWTRFGCCFNNKQQSLSIRSDLTCPLSPKSYRSHLTQILLVKPCRKENCHICIFTVFLEQRAQIRQVTPDFSSNGSGRS